MTEQQRKTEETKQRRAKEMRYKKPIVRNLNLETIQNELWEMQSECEDVRWFTDGDEDTLINALDGDEDEAYEFRMMFADLSAECERMSYDLEEAWVPDCFDRFFVAMGAGDGYGGIFGYDSYEGDFAGGKLPMDKTVLIEYADVKEEVKDLRRRIRNLEDEITKLENSVVSDTVACGRKGRKPIKTVKITGTPDAAITRKRTSLRARQTMLREKEVELLERQAQAEEFINGIEKSELRTILRLRYIDGLMWHQVAHRMNQMYPRKSYTEDNCKQRNKRFFDNL